LLRHSLVCPRLVTDTINTYLICKKKFSQKYLLTRFGMGKAKGVARKQRKEKKNRAKKVRGAKKTAVLKSAGK